MPQKSTSGANGKAARHKWLNCPERPNICGSLTGTVALNGHEKLNTIHRNWSNAKVQCHWEKRGSHHISKAATTATTKEITVCWKQTIERTKSEKKITALERREMNSHTLRWKLTRKHVCLSYNNPNATHDTQCDSTHIAFEQSKHRTRSWLFAGVKQFPWHYDTVWICLLLFQWNAMLTSSLKWLYKHRCRANMTSTAFVAIHWHGEFNICGTVRMWGT